MTFKVEHVDRGPHGGKGLIKMWHPEGYPFEAQAMDQIRGVAKMPFIHKHVAVMPDAHAGKGSTVGTVIATDGVIIPAAVGVDIGCGMMAMRLSIGANELPDTLAHIRGKIEAAVPHGRGSDDQIRSGRDPGSWGNVPPSVSSRWQAMTGRYDEIIAKHPKIAPKRHPSEHIGTLGTGNHFIELCLDEDDRLWVMLHSGSRGIGNKIGSYFIEKAQREMERYHIMPHLSDRDLAYLVEHTVLFDDYVEAVDWAQEYAMENRKAMMHAVLNVLHATLPPFMVTDDAINCHHNYVTRENHFGKNVLVTRKGAVQAREGTMGIIPGSMGTGSFIVRGKGNPDSFCSCSHGAGRVMSRTAAKKLISMEQHAEAMKGIEARLDVDIIDESPAAYKPIGLVMDAQDDLVEVVHRLRQVVNVKG